MSTEVKCVTDISDRDLGILKHKWYYEKTNAEITASLGWSKSTIARAVRKGEAFKDELMEKWCSSPIVGTAMDSDEVKTETLDNGRSTTKNNSEEIPAHFVTSDVVTVAIDGKVHTFDRTHPNYDSIRNAVVDGDWNSVNENADYQQKFNKLTFGFFEITEYGEIMHHGERMADNHLTEMILELHKKDVKPAAIFKFMDRLKESPSLVSIESAIRFVTNNKLPIDKDGYLLTYKRINNDYTDCHTGTIDNSVGQVVAMERDSVTLNPSQTCAAGLHVCSHGYLTHFSDGKTVVCRVDPSDIVSVPHDYKNAKMRVMRYEVVHELDYDNGELIPDNFIDETCGWYHQ